MNNWRTLTLLNTDYKIVNEIKKDLLRHFDCSQTSFIKGRYIGENSRHIQETIEMLENENMLRLLYRL